MRSSPNFLTLNNIIGKVNANSTAEVVDEKILPSGNKAFKIKLSSIKPKTNSLTQSTEESVWIYGSSQFVEPDKKNRTEASHINEPRCLECLSRTTSNVRNLSSITQKVEAQNSTEDNSSSISSEAQKMVSLAQAQGMICNLNSKSLQIRGIECKGRISSYPEPVRIYIPKNYIKSNQNNINFFFHGFEEVTCVEKGVTKKCFNDIYRMNPNDGKGAGDFGARLAESGNSTGIVVVPESRGEGKTYQLFADGSGQFFQKLKDQIEKIADTKFAKTTFAAHSGGRLPVAALLNYPAISETIKNIALFDTTYTDSLPITNWINKYPDTHALVSWTATGEVVAKTKVFISKVQRKEQLTIASTAGTHMDNIREGGYSDFLKD